MTYVLCVWLVCSLITNVLDRRLLKLKDRLIEAQREGLRLDAEHILLLQEALGTGPWRAEP